MPFCHLDLGNFEVPISEIRPEELIDLTTCFAELVTLEKTIGVTKETFQSCPNPGIREAPFWFIFRFRGCVLKGGEDKTTGVPHLIGKIAVRLHFLKIQVCIMTGG